MHVKDYSQMIGWLTRDKTTDVPGSMAHEARIMDQAALVDDVVPGPLKDEMLGKFDPSQETYEEYLQRINLERPFNMNQGGRIGFGRGKKATILTPQMVIDIADNNPDFTATDIFKKLQKDKTKNYVTAKGTPINRQVINRTLSKTFDLQEAEKAKVPKGYISAQEFFNTPGMPINKHNYMTVKNRNPSLLTNTIGKNAIFVKRGKGGEGAYYYKKPTQEDIKLYQKIYSRKGQLNPNTINLMFEFDKKFGKLYEKGELPDLKTIQKKISADITPSTAGNVTARLSQWYNGSDFINPELKNLNRNKSLAKKIQKASNTGLYGNFYADQAYKIALDTIDEKIGRRVGSFKAFKDNIKTALKEAGLPIYSKNSPYGFNLNEMAGITGAARTKTAAFSDFVDIAEGQFNQKQLADFQKNFAKVREDLDKLDLPNNPKNKTKAQSLIDNFKDTITYYEKATGSELPKLGLGTADQYYSAKKLSDIGKERSVGETGKKKFRKIPGTDLLKASKDAGYTVIVPENYRTVGQIMETGERGILKKNVQNTLEGMKKFFNEYDEKKMFQKLKNATPETLRRMMKVIPKFVSLEDDIKRYASANNIMSDATYVDDVEEKFTRRNPITTQALGSTAVGGAALAQKPIRTGLGKAFRTLGTRAGVTPFAGYTIYDNLKKGENVVDATLDPWVGAELMLPNMFKENVAKITSSPKIQKLLSLGYKIPKTAFTVGRAFTPIGAGITAAGLGIDAYKYIKKRRAELAAMSPEERAELAQKQDEISFGEYSGAAEGGIMSLKKKW